MRDELAAIANGTGNADLRVRSLQPRAIDALELGDRGALEVVLEEQAALARSQRHPWLAWQAKLWSTMRALLAGRVAEADALAHESLRDGRRIQQEIALEWYGVQIYQVRREQERLAELEPAIQRFAALYPKITTWPITLALLEAEDGRRDAALRRVRELAPMRLRRDVNKLVSLAVLAEAIWQLRDAESAAAAYGALSPYVGRHVMIGGAVAGYGSVDRYVGLLAQRAGPQRGSGAPARIRTARGFRDGRRGLRRARRARSRDAALRTRRGERRRARPSARGGRRSRGCAPRQSRVSRGARVISTRRCAVPCRCAARAGRRAGR